MMPIGEDAVVVARRDPQSWAARNAIIDLHRQCRADPNAALQVAQVGGVDAAVAVLNATGGAEALGLLWTLSASKGTLQHFTQRSLEAVVNTGRDAGDGWRRTAALSTMHNLLCYDGHDLVLSSSAGSLELAVEILCSDSSPSVKSAASKLLDQCCFDERSKLAAVNLLPVRVVADILRQSLSQGCKGSAAGSREEASERALLVLVEDTLSLLWNASDDVFFCSRDDWLRVTTLLCEPSLLDALSYCLRSPVLCHQQAASATLHNMASNALLLPMLIKAGVASGLSKLARHPAPSSICAILAVTELCGLEEGKDSSRDSIAHFSDSLVAAVVHELDRRVAVSANFEDNSKTARLQEVVGTRKLVSAIDVLASRADCKLALLHEGAIGVIVASLQQRRTDSRGTLHCLDILTHLSFEPACKLAMQRAHPDLIPTLRQLCGDKDAVSANAARALVYVLMHLDALTPRSSRQQPHQYVALLSYHDRESGLAARLREGLRQEHAWRLSSFDDVVCSGDFERALSALDEASVLVVLVSPSLKRSARSRLMLNIAVRRGILIVPLLAVGGYVPDGWLSALASRAESDTMAAQIPRVGTATTEEGLISGLQELLERRACCPPEKPDAMHTPVRDVARGGRREGETGVNGGDVQPSFLANAFAGLVNTLSPRGMPATPRGDMAGPSPSPRLGLLLKQDYEGGDVYVGTVVPGGMAARTGAIREGDVITRVDGCTTAGLSVLAVTELVRGLPLSEHKARARAAESRAMREDEVRITLRRQGRPLEAVMPRPPQHLVQAHAAGAAPPNHQTGMDASAAARRQTQQGKYNEDAVPPHLRARAGPSGAHSERVRESSEMQHGIWHADGPGFAATSSGGAPTGQDAGGSSMTALEMPSAAEDSSPNGGLPKVVPSLFGKGPFMGSTEPKASPESSLPLSPSVRAPALYASDTARRQRPGEEPDESGAESRGEDKQKQQAVDGKRLATDVVPATSHESDSEEWVESSAGSSLSSDDESDSDDLPDVKAPADAGIEEEDSWADGEIPGSTGLKARAPQTRISFRNALLSVELLWNLRGAVETGGWMAAGATVPKHRILLSGVFHAWRMQVDELWSRGRLPRTAAPDCATGVENAEDLSHEDVLAWVAQCELDADVGQSFRQKRVDGQELRKLFFLFRHNFVDFLARVKSQHGITQYGVALSLAHELSLLFNSSAASPLEAAVPPLGGLGGRGGKVPTLQLGRASNGDEAGGEAKPLVVKPLKLPTKS